MKTLFANGLGRSLTVIARSISNFPLRTQSFCSSFLPFFFSACTCMYVDMCAVSALVVEEVVEKVVEEVVVSMCAACQNVGVWLSATVLRYASEIIHVGVCMYYMSLRFRADNGIMFGFSMFYLCSSLRTSSSSHSPIAIASHSLSFFSTFSLGFFFWWFKAGFGLVLFTRIRFTVRAFAYIHIYICMSYVQ